MSFQPVLVGGGLSGWQFLQSTLPTQKAAFERGAQLSRDTAYFAEKIGEITSAEDLVADRRLLRVALGAFGLQDDIDNKFFIRKILEDGTTSPEALSNRLADDRYKAFSKAFGFGEITPPRTGLSYFGTEVLDKYRAQQFEVAVGAQDENLRLAMNLERALPELAQEAGSNDMKWFRIMGTPPLREVFETALGLPDGFGQIDIDQQLETLKDRAQSRFGSDVVTDLATPDVLEKIVQNYLLQTQISASQSTGSGQVALMLLQSIPRT
ncbi:DUF1217 domain-containing protein [Thalassococcus sp. BH17M4-6]|uniref:DUF1217 domain-containing protein n=1 Tax=Thalassococcus sp. BH17M4-6 TaxID=3413148 RepID=UPI003BE44603